MNNADISSTYAIVPGVLPTNGNCVLVE